MAPLNTDKINEDERQEDGDECTNNITELTGAYGNLARSDFVCRKRNSASHLKLWSANDLSKSHDKGNEQNTYNTFSKDSVDLRKEPCAKCLEKKKTDMTVYHKQKEHALTSTISVRAVLNDLSPQWFKRFINDPEYIMTETKTADPAE